MKILFGDISNSLGTRVLGSEIRAKIEKSLAEGDFISFDFSGVDSISHSFADECFGKLLLSFELAHLKSGSTFLNTNDLVKKIILFTLNERALQPV